MAGVRHGPSTFQLIPVLIDHPHAVSLTEQVQRLYVERYGSPDEAPIDPSCFAPPSGAFFVGYLEDEPVAMGAWRRTDVELDGVAQVAEIKRMYVAPQVQRRGLARRLLAHLEDSAREAGFEAVVLETGTKQPEAIALYVASGYLPIPGYGYYRGSPLSRCFGKRLHEVAANNGQT